MLTPLEKSDSLAKKVGVSGLFLKREDKTPSGSFKFRAAERQLEHLVERGKKAAVISSSGNAAISLAREAKDQGIQLYAFLSPDTPPAKLEELSKYKPVIILSKRAMRLANYMSAHHRLPNLRPSVDDHAVIGFISLGEEIDEQMEENGGAQAIVSFMTSGASVLGISKGYRTEPVPKLIAVASDEVGRLGTARGRVEDVKQVADIVSVEKIDVEKAREVLLSENIIVADEAIASFAAIMKLKPEGNVVWVVSGKDWGESEYKMSPDDFFKAETFEDIDHIYASTRI
ncbi:MAG: PLP-dependent lyase/thiolase [bacterium]|nr:PLP-dependent lyase/thiolase [bacterium]